MGSAKLFYFCKSDVSAAQGHPRSLILVRIESAYRYATSGLLVRHSNLGPILHRFGDIAGLTVLLTPFLLHSNFWVFPLHQIAHVGVSPRISLKLFGREIIFEEFQPM